MPSLEWAPNAYRMLNGVFCIFKPQGECVHQAINIIKGNLARDLNALPCYNQEVLLKGQNSNEKTMTVVGRDEITDWTEHRLVLGKRYILDDFNINFVDGISRHTSGVVVLGVGNHGRSSMGMIAASKFLRVYHVKGRFGLATDNFSPKGKILERTSYRHVNRNLLGKICSAAQASHSRQMYIYSGVSPDSQAAYELVSSGIIRPAHRNTPPILYGIKCIDFTPPDFTLEIHSINEKCIFLRRFIHDIALKLKTTAVCTGIRRLRYGHFDLDRALLRQEWNLESILENIQKNEELLTTDRLLLGAKTEEVKLLEYNKKGKNLLSSTSSLSHETEADRPEEEEEEEANFPS